MGLVKNNNSKPKYLITCKPFETNTIIQKASIENPLTNTSVHTIPENSIINVPDNTIMITTINNQILDFCAEPGNYSFQASVPPSIFLGNFNNLESTIKSLQSSSSYTIPGSHNISAYYINTKIIPGNKFGTATPQSITGISSNITFFGEYTIQVDNPLALIKYVVNNRKKDVIKSQDLFNSSYKSWFVSIITTALNNVIKITNATIDNISTYNSNIIEQLNNILSTNNEYQYGIKIKDISLTFGKSKENNTIGQTTPIEFPIPIKQTSPNIQNTNHNINDDNQSSSATNLTRISTIQPKQNISTPIVGSMPSNITIHEVPNSFSQIPSFAEPQGNQIKPTLPFNPQLNPNPKIIPNIINTPTPKPTPIPNVSGQTTTIKPLSNNNTITNVRNEIPTSIIGPNQNKQDNQINTSQEHAKVLPISTPPPIPNPQEPSTIIKPTTPTINPIYEPPKSNEDQSLMGFMNLAKPMPKEPDSIKADKLNIDNPTNQNKTKSLTTDAKPKEEIPNPPLIDKVELPSTKEEPHIPKFCSYCGKPTTGSKFCGYCGAKLI